MKAKYQWLFTLLMVFSIVLGACGGSNVVVAEPPAEPVTTEAPMVDEPAVFDLADLDTAYTTFLGDMVKYNTIGLEALNTALAEDPPFILDVRNASEAEEKGHIPGAILIPLRELAQNTAYLPSFDTPIVSYCGSGWRCTIALTALEGMGWEDVTCLKGNSFGGWVDAGYEVASGVPAEAEMLSAVEIDETTLAYFDDILTSVPEGYGGITAEALNTELAENSDLILIDSRTQGELDSKGTIESPNFIHIPLESFVADMDMWPEDLDAEIVVYCGSGHRSTIAMTILWSYGYTNVRSLKSGFGGWASAGYPTVGGVPDLDAAYSTFLADMVKYNTIGLETLNTALAEDPPFLLDVRNASEAEEKGHIPGAILIPLRDLAQNTAYLPSFDTPIVSYCGSGWRCTIALTALEGMGWDDVTCLKGNSFGGWVDAGYAIEEGIPADAEMLSAVVISDLTIDYFDNVLSNVPDGYGGITAEALNTEIAENSDLILIDSRTTGEMDEKGVIDAPNLLGIPLETFVEMKDQWPADKDAEIVVYCGSGHRSTIAMTILWSYGYTNVRSLKSGFGGWADAGYPVSECPACP